MTDFKLNIVGLPPSDIMQQMIDIHPELVNLLLRLRGIRHHRAIEEYQAAVLYHLAKQFDDENKWMLEIGTANGYSASVLASGSRAHLVTLNPNEDEVNVARKNLQAMLGDGRENVAVVPKTSVDYLKEFRGEFQFDLIFVDGDHKNVRLDLPYWDRLKVGGMMLFHDYSPNGTYRACPPVYRALNDFSAALGREFDVLVVDDGGVGFAGFVKRDTDTLDIEERDLLAGVTAYSSASYETIVGLYKLAAGVSDVEGEIVECGVQNGGSLAALALGVGWDRDVWGFDTFTGVPKPGPEDGEKAMSRWLSKQPDGWAVGSEAKVRELFEVNHIRDLHLVKGDFADTFAQEVFTEPLTLLHIDATTYAATLASLNRFYKQMLPGGRVIISGYHHWQGIKQAVNDFAFPGGLKPTMHTLEQAVWWNVS